MNTNVRFVGLDYHQNSVQVCVMDGNGRVVRNRGCANDWRQIDAFASQDGAGVQAAIESCSGAADLADELIERAGWSVDIAHAGYVARIKQNPDKTDFTDAQLLADLERVGYVPRVWLPPVFVRLLRQLVRHRQQLVNRRRAQKLRVGGLLREWRVGPAPANRWTRSWIEWARSAPGLPETTCWIIEELLDEIDGIVRRIARAEEHLARITAHDPLVRRLMEERGVGLVTACVLRAEIGRFDRFRNGKQVSRFCGLSPRNASSGARQADAGLIGACSRMLRATIIEASHRLIRFDRTWRDLASRLRSRGKPASVTVAAVANRWMRRLYHEMKPLGIGA